VFFVAQIPHLQARTARANKRRMLIMTDIKVITVTLKLDTSVVENQLRQIASELMSMADRIAETDIQEEE
jgi:hypothetical protein